MLARFYPEASSHPVVLNCGQTARSNHDAISYLTKHYERSIRLAHGDGDPFCFVPALRSPLVYGVKSVRLVKDVTSAAFASASHLQAGEQPAVEPATDDAGVDVTDTIA